MSPKLDLAAIAERIRTLIAAKDGGDLDATARRLHVEARSLARSIDVGFPHPSIAVITAVIREYGVDPSWLFYGEYDAATHGVASELGTALLADDVLRLVDSPKHTFAGDVPTNRLETQLGA